MTNYGDGWTKLINSIKPGSKLKVTVTKHKHFGFFVAVPGTNYEGLVEIMFVKDEGKVSPTDYPDIGSIVEAVVLGFREHNHQIVLSMKPSDLTQAK